jgi:hypothetical protein
LSSVEYLRNENRFPVHALCRLPPKVQLYHHRNAGSKIKYDTVLPNEFSLITLVSNKVSQMTLVKNVKYYKDNCQNVQWFIIWNMCKKRLMKIHLQTNMNQCIGLWCPLRDILTWTIERFQHIHHVKWVHLYWRKRTLQGVRWTDDKWDEMRWVLKIGPNLHTHTVLQHIVHFR